jgi:E3 ubiquitin-protein ligase NEDD4
MDNTIDDNEYMELFFQHEHNGQMYPLCINGDNKKVTDDNKESYVLQKIDFMMKNFTFDQVLAIRKGFSSLIPFNLLEEFNEKEFEYLCCGKDEIDIDDWIDNTLYSGNFNHNHNVVKWFWNFIRSIDLNSRRIIFQFVTGMSRLPAEGFKALNRNRGERQFFNIRSIPYEESDPYPKAFTCFNRLHLPIYPNEDLLVENLQRIVDQGEVFGFGLEE